MNNFNPKELIGTPRIGAQEIHPPAVGKTENNSTEVINADVRTFADTNFVISNTME